MVKLNGNIVENAEGKSLSQVLKDNGFPESRIAVEINGEIAPKRTWSEVTISDGYNIEVVSFVGGG